MRKKAAKHHMDGVFALLLFAVFAGCILLTLLFGASSYEKLVERDQRSYEQRTGVQYIAAKIRHSDKAGLVSVGSFSDRKAIDGDEINTLYLQFEGEDGIIPGFYTKIYYYDGYIREVLCAEDGGLEPDAGGEILAAKGLSLSQEGSLIHITVTNEDGSESSLCLTPRSGMEEQL